MTDRRERLDSIDLVRGLVMVIMLLDHSRDFIHEAAFAFAPTDLSRTTALLFLTRWITHFCAPIFVFLAGTAAFLWRDRGGKSKGQLSWFLLTRGLWLVLLEITAVHFGHSFELDLGLIGPLQVIWAIGCSMIVLAALVQLPVWAIAVFALVQIVGHNALDGFHVGGGGPPPHDALRILWLALHQGGPARLGEHGPMIFFFYPLVPWLGVMAAGYVFGAVFRLGPEQRRRALLTIGLGLSATFVVLRALNVYGDRALWSAQPSPLFTVLSFLNTTKYPPSLLFLLMTLGPAITLLGLLTAREAAGPLSRALIHFGRVPLFFYLLQWPTAHLMGIVFTAIAGRSLAPYFGSPIEHFMHPPESFGFPLPYVFLGWALGVALLYLPCRWFAGVKERHRDWWWLSYL